MVTEQADFILSCPPYFDLERYSNDPRDLSTMRSYNEFRTDYSAIIKSTCSMLKNDRFGCFVVGDVRDKSGCYYGFPRHTIDAFEAAGLRLFNEIILVTAISSLPLRVRSQFETSRKVGRRHQHVLVFVKGNQRKAAGACEVLRHNPGDDDLTIRLAPRRRQPSQKPQNEYDVTDDLIRECAARLIAACSNTLPELFALGDLLIAQQEKLRGNWCRMFKTQPVPFGLSKADRLMKIAMDTRLEIRPHGRICHWIRQLCIN